MGKLAKIELHYEDGTITSLEGDDADKWLVACNAMTGHAYVHGFRMPVFTWKARKLQFNVTDVNALSDEFDKGSS